jgi:transaldolase
MHQFPNQELIWASSRELLNIYHVDEIGRRFITVINNILKKYISLGKDLNDFSLNTVKMLYVDAKAANFEI